MAKRKPRIKSGDIFAIPLDERRIAYGQVLLHRRHNYPIYIVVFRPLWPADATPSVEEILSSDPTLLGGSIWPQKWTVFAHASPDLDQFPWPHFVCRFDGHCVVEDFHGQVIRNATPEDERFYGCRSTHSPTTYENALKAIHELGQWSDRNADLTFEHVLSRAARNPTLEIG